MKLSYMIAYILRNLILSLYTGNTAVFPVGNESKELKIKGVNNRSLTNLNELFVIVPDKTYEQVKQVNETRTVKILM